MTMKRNSSAKGGNKKKIPKLDTDDIMDYTKLLTNEAVETIGSDNEQELDIVNKTKKIKPVKKNQIVKKKTTKTEKGNVLKKIKGKPSSITGIYLLMY